MWQPQPAVHGHDLLTPIPRQSRQPRAASSSGARSRRQSSARAAASLGPTPGFVARMRMNSSISAVWKAACRLALSQDQGNMTLPSCQLEQRQMLDVSYWTSRWTSYLRLSGSCSFLGRSTKCRCSCCGSTRCCSTASSHGGRPTAVQHALLPACCILSCSAGSLPWGVKAQRGTWQPGLLPAANAQTRGTASRGLWIAG